MRFQGDCFRAHDPRWSYTPLSGDGAAVRGARFNPKGTPALYLALSVEGAVAEAAQGFAGKLEPLTICLYEVDCEGVADLSADAGRRAAGVTVQDMACPWAQDLAEHRVPASWHLAERMIAEGYAGLLVPSFAERAPAGTVNLVLWSWGATLPHRVVLHDPALRLPRDRSSWRD